MKTIILLALLGLAVAIPVPHGFYRVYISLGHLNKMVLGPGGADLWDTKMYENFENTFIKKLETK